MKKHFKSLEKYQKWLAYGHMHKPSGGMAMKESESIFGSTPGHQEIIIHGKPHKVHHKKIF